MPSVSAAQNIQKASEYVAENTATVQRAGKEDFAKARTEDRPERLKYNKPLVQDEIKTRLTKDATMAGQADAIRQTFGVDQAVLKKETDRSGFDVIAGGVLNNIQLGKDTARTGAEGFRPTGSKDVLQAWEQANSGELRKVVKELSKSPDQLREETAGRHWGVDVQA